MRVHLLGGASEVGASCVVVEAAGRRVLVDAGIRPGASDPLPDLARLQDLGGIDAVVVSHAHADHIGALPLVAGAFPAAPIFASPPTAALMAVMLQDAVRIAEARLEEGGDLPAYGEAAVARLLERVRPLPPLRPVACLPAAGAEGGWEATLFPAGHVLGAAMVLLDTPDGALVVSGDVSFARQRTVGAAVPPRRRVRALVLESTYGNRLHSDRAAEEARLVAQVREVLGRGGHCLIPAFALGRAQEVLLILSDARRRGLLPEEAPVWVDGLVRAVCGVYTAHGAAGSVGLRRLVERQGDPFFHRATRAVRRPEDRTALLSGPPSVIVASSGMLTGGPSVFYAERLAGDPRHAILITGYQDEEAPGRRLLDLAQAAEGAGERRLALHGAEVVVACEVARYNLSAHADGDQLAALAERLRPGITLLVHGDPDARVALGEKIAAMGLHCRLPANGETVDLPGRGRRRVPLASRPDPTAESLAELVRGPGANRAWSAIELADRHYGAATADGVVRVVAALAAEGSAWRPDERRTGLYRLQAGGSAAGGADLPAGADDSEQERVRRLVAAAFDGEPTLTKAGFHIGERRVELRFHFPDVARIRHAERIAALSAETGWEVEVRPQPDLEALQSAALRHLPPGVEAVGRPGLHPDAGVVAVKVRGDAAPDEVAAAQRAYREETGHGLELRREDTGSPLAEAGADAVPTSSRMEINAAYAAVRAALEAEGARSYRIGRRGSVIEVAFLTAVVGRRHRPTLDRVQDQVGWPVAIYRHPQQQALAELVRATVTRPIAKGPGIHAAEQRITVRLGPGAPVTAEEVAAWRRAVLEASGYTLEVAAAP